MTKQGRIVSRTGNPESPDPTRRLFTPHSIALDSRGNIYIADLLSSWRKVYPEAAVPLDRGTGKKIVRRPAHA